MNFNLELVTQQAHNKMLEKILKYSSLRLPHFKTPQHKRYFL